MRALVAQIQAAGGTKVSVRRDAEHGWRASALAYGAPALGFGITREAAFAELLAGLTRPEDDEPRCCSICDAPGHGYPGGGPCPLEDRGWADSFTEEGRREAYLEACEDADMSDAWAAADAAGASNDPGEVARAGMRIRP